MKLAAINGRSIIINPYINQSAIPVVKIMYINNDIPLVSFVLNILITCGRNAQVVHAAAVKPIIVAQDNSTSAPFFKMYAPGLVICVMATLASVNIVVKVYMNRLGTQVPRFFTPRRLIFFWQVAVTVNISYKCNFKVQVNL